jgi:hypothetical protein
MYYYIEEPEIQSPEQRSVVFASLAAYFSLLMALWFGLFHWFIKGRAESLFDVAFPVLTTFIILYCGSLCSDWGRLARIALLSTVSILIFIGMIFFAGLFTLAVMYSYSEVLRHPWT